MDYKNIDFNFDVVAMYSKLREGMALAFDAEYLRSYQKRKKTSLKAELSCYTVKSLIKRVRI
jgi:hypothetical protein